MTYFYVGVAIALTAASAGMSAYSASEQASAQKQQADYEAEVQANNAKIAAQQRSAALQQGEEEAQRSMMEQSQTLARQRAALAANGLDLNSGTAIDLQATTKFLGQQDVNAIENNATRRAWGYQVDSASHAAESNLSKWRADNTNPTKAGVTTGVSSLLSSASLYASAKKR